MILSAVRHDSDSEGHGQILFRASSADGRRRGARPEGPDRPDHPPDDVAADQEAVQNPGASVSLGSKPRRRCRGPFPLHVPDDLRYLG
jgi:hypothetical protein